MLPTADARVNVGVTMVKQGGQGVAQDEPVNNSLIIHSPNILAASTLHLAT